MAGETDSIKSKNNENKLQGLICCTKEIVIQHAKRSDEKEQDLLYDHKVNPVLKNLT